MTKFDSSQGYMVVTKRYMQYSKKGRNHMIISINTESYLTKLNVGKAL